MLLLVGLGNPGAKYQANRHNIGFLAADAIARAYHFGPSRSRFQSEFSEGDINGEKVLLLKPQTYMNESGRAVGEALRFYKLDPKDVLVMHDELDLAPGKIRVKAGGGHGGHNGLRSIDAHIGKDYRRLRIGIGHPGHKDLVHHYVLSDFAKADAEWAKPLLDAIAAEAGWLAKGDDARFATAVSLRLSPPQKQTKAAPSSAADQVKD